MPRQRSEARVLGPYPKRDKWRLVVRDERGAESFVSYATQEEAERVKRALLTELRHRQPRKVEEALDAYEVFLRDVKQNKPTSIRTTMIRLRTFFPDESIPLADVTPRRAAAMYLNLTRAQSVDSHRNILAEARTFLKWCVQTKKWLATNPLADIQGVGKRKHGKPQLRIDEARRWLAVASQLAEDGDAGAIAAMTTLLLGLRSSEVTDREVRDLDDGGRQLWIPDSKTAAGRRRLEVPEVLQPHLRGLAEAKLPNAPLFGHHWRDWPRKQVKPQHAGHRGRNHCPRRCQQSRPRVAHRDLPQLCRPRHRPASQLKTHSDGTQRRPKLILAGNESLPNRCPALEVAEKYTLAPKQKSPYFRGEVQAFKCGAEGSRTPGL